MRRTTLIWASTVVGGMALGGCGERTDVNEQASVEVSQVASEGGEHGSDIAVAGDEKDFAGSSFDSALNMVLEGEGGKGGAGMTPMIRQGAGYASSVPALTGPQVSKAVSGNSLRSDRHFAVQFLAGGNYKGLSLIWQKAPSANCPKPTGARFTVVQNQCYVAVEHPLAGRWTVRDDQLCMEPRAKGVNDADDCVRLALVLNSVIFFGKDGRMIGKGADLLPGDVPLDEGAAKGSQSG